MNKQKNQILILLGVIMTGVLYVYIQYFFLPQLGVLKEKTDHLAARQAYLWKLEENDRILPSLKEQAQDLTVQASALDKSVPKKVDKPDIMLTVYNLAKKNALNPKNLNYEPVKDEGGFYTMGMNFDCTGSAESVYRLAEQFLQGNKYIFVLDSISMSPGEGGVSAKMRLVAYIYKKM